MARPRLDKTVPVRVTEQDVTDLRRWAEESDSSVSDVIRELIRNRRFGRQRSRSDRRGDRVAA